MAFEMVRLKYFVTDQNVRLKNTTFPATKIANPYNPYVGGTAAIWDLFYNDIELNAFDVSAISSLPSDDQEHVLFTLNNGVKIFGRHNGDYIGGGYIFTDNTIYYQISGDNRFDAKKFREHLYMFLIHDYSNNATQYVNIFLDSTYPNDGYFITQNFSPNGGSLTRFNEIVADAITTDDIIGTGGGATHIAKVTGALSALSSNLSDILIAAGGGGGGLVSDGTPTTGANAGGISGSGNNSANQSTGYAFGQGENYGGGGGLYGGYQAADGDSGGAGSGYIGNALLDAKKMVGYNVPTSSAEGTKTESVNVYSATAEENKAKAGNGFAKITWLRDLPPTPPVPSALYDWDFTESLIDKVQGEEIILTNATRDSSGIYFNNDHCGADIPASLLQVGREYEIHFGTVSISSPGIGNRRIFVFGSSNHQYDCGLEYRGAQDKYGVFDWVTYWQMSDKGDLDYFSNSILKIQITSDGKWHLYKDNILFYETPIAVDLTDNATFSLGSTIYGAYFMTITAFKIFAIDE